MKTYDVGIIGAGPGGYVAAIRAAQLGLSVLLVEKDNVGGTCLNRGCIPTKTLLESSGAYRKQGQLSELGIQTADSTYDMTAIYSRKDRLVNQIRTGVETLLKKNKIQLAIGEGIITGATQIEVAGETYEAEHIIIAAGLTPALPPIKGVELSEVVTSDDILTVPETLDEIVIVGGGVIGVEIASFYNDLGCKVTILEAMPRILATFDREISQNLSMILKRRGVEIKTNVNVTGFSKENSQIACTYEEKDEMKKVVSDKVLMATGRRVSQSKLFSEDLGIKTERGFIVVDDDFKTSVPSIYAIGDIVAGNTQLAHVASAQGINVVSQIANQAPPYDLDVIPGCVYTTPEIASVGLSEAEAKEKGFDVEIGKYVLSGNARHMIKGGDRGFIKIITEKESGKLLGAVIMADTATEMISEYSTAIVNKLTTEEMLSVIHPHPTVHEGIIEALDNISKRGIHSIPR
ncbi:dihydrolipoyl dehydrogenase [Vagococcus elongatus]|uniref:Dihydrolipoyl dehydrogenase n=1 Tax=Vagococcus elongatus TaxID=180344 RepID=A0A430AX45_9ENTE|nr:dihydrolipoyl dehydrogenase [Vagococcus elongatus]RSU12647.1 dihydrolipoyl dehydrogenase [Vagococcus elongatus]